MITRIWHGATPAAKSDEYLTKLDAHRRHTRLPLDPRHRPVARRCDSRSAVAQRVTEPSPRIFV
jgi:hypothetical protein